MREHLKTMSTRLQDLAEKFKRGEKLNPTEIIEVCPAGKSFHHIVSNFFSQFHGCQIDMNIPSYGIFRGIIVDEGHCVDFKGVCGKHPCCPMPIRSTETSYNFGWGLFTDDFRWARLLDEPPCKIGRGK